MSRSLAAGADRQESLTSSESLRVVVRYRSSFVLLLVLQLSGCATHELVLSRTLQPALARPEVDFHLTLFRARVQMDRLEVWGRVRRGVNDYDYTTSFDTEIRSVASLCAALAHNGLIFENDWNVLHLILTNEYGSQLRWKTANSYTKIIIERRTLMELKRLNTPASEYPKYWQLTAYKVGPPDYSFHEWTPGRSSDAAIPQE